MDDVICAYHAACLKRGQNKQLGEDMIWGAGVYLADSSEEAIRRLEPAHDERFKWFAPFGFVRYPTSRVASGARRARPPAYRC